MTGDDTTLAALDPGIVERFRRDGFVIVDDVFTPAEMDRMTDAVVAAVAADVRYDGRTLSERSRYEQSFQQCLYLWARYPEVAPWSAHPRLAAVAAALLGADAVRIWHDQALFKEPGGRPTDAHQDHPYWPIREPDQVTAWIPLDGSTQAAGAMSYWPGSHRLGLDQFVNIFGADDPEDIASHPALRGVDPIVLEVPRGSVAFHHGLTAHRAAGNVTDRTRRVHTVIFTADGVHRSEGLGHPSVDLDGIAPGERITGAMTPVVWPAPPSVPAAPPEFVEAIEAGRRARLAERLGR